MSVKVMTAVFERYPVGGGEMLLALSLADHAHDDGSHIFPKVEALAQKTRQSVRSVQYQLRRMEESGWLIRVGSGSGGRSRASEYRISAAWIKGAEIAPINNGADVAPFDGEKGATDDRKGCNPRQKRVQPVAPAYNRHRTIIEPIPPQPPTGGEGDESVKASDLFEDAWAAYPRREGGNSKADAHRAWTARLNAGVDPQLMLAGTHRYARYVRAIDREGSRFVKQAATFFGPGLHFLDAWDSPAPGQQTARERTNMAAATISLMARAGRGPESQEDTIDV